MKDIVFLELNHTQESKIKISPCGSFKGIDGREFHLDSHAVLKRLQQKGRDLMLDKDHQDKEALGWFDLSSIEARNDGIYASLELNSIGKALVEDKVYRYLSPAYLKDNVGNVTDIVSIGLVNRPNLSELAALNTQNTPQGEKMNEEQIKALQDELTKSKDLIKSLEEKCVSLEKQIQEKDKQREEEEQKQKVARVDAAIAANAMLPARKDVALCINKEGFEAFLEMCKHEAQNVLKNKSATFDATGGNDDIDENIKAQLGLN